MDSPTPRAAPHARMSTPTAASRRVWALRPNRPMMGSPTNRTAQNHAAPRPARTSTPTPAGASRRPSPSPTTGRGSAASRSCTRRTSGSSAVCWRPGPPPLAKARKEGAGGPASTPQRASTHLPTAAGPSSQRAPRSALLHVRTAPAVWRGGPPPCRHRSLARHSHAHASEPAATAQAVGLAHGPSCWPGAALHPHYRRTLRRKTCPKACAGSLPRLRFSPVATEAEPWQSRQPRPASRPFKPNQGGGVDAS